MVLSTCNEHKMICARETEVYFFGKIFKFCAETKENPEFPCPSIDFIHYKQPGKQPKP